MAKRKQSEEPRVSEEGESEDESSVLEESSSDDVIFTSLHTREEITNTGFRKLIW